MCRKGIFLTTQRAGTAKMPLSSFVLPIIDNGMKAETPSFEAHQFVRVRRGDAVRRLIQRDKTPLAVLFMAAVVGTLAGLVGVAFEKSVNWVQNQRIGALAQVADHWYLVWPLAFILSALLAMVGYFLVRRFAPEAGGSGIPEIEGALEELRPVRWWRVLPVKFVGGMGTLGAGMVLGREGPMVQLGGNIGRMVLDVFRMRSPEARHTLLATGAASGLSAAFNAPLAGILFIIEEMRPQFRYNLISIKAVFTGVIMSSIVFRIFNGEAAIIEVGKLSNAPVNTLWLYLVLGMLFPATAAEGPAGKRRITQQTQEYIRRFRERFVDRDCADLLKRKDLMPTGQSRDLGVADHCGILIVSAVEILCDYIAELKGE